MPFEQIRVSPVLDTAAYADADVLFDATEMQLPIDGPCVIKNITIIDRDQNNMATSDMQMIFLNKSSSIGTVSATADGITAGEAVNDIVGFFHVKALTFSATNDFDAFNIMSSADIFRNADSDDTSASAKNMFSGNIVVKPLAGERSVYVAAVVSGGDTPTFAGTTPVTVNDGSNYSADQTPTITVDGADPRDHFVVGDTVRDASNVIIGVIESMTSTTITFTTNNIGALTDDDVLHTSNSLTLVFDVEY
tara:strand:- start:47 stop:796 length:750 start_codon:yes stop_codon:yes gene_type:complete